MVETPTTSAPASSAPRPAVDRLLLFCRPELAAADLERVLRALRAELTDLPAEVIAECSDRSAALPARIDAATAAAEAHGALAVIWLDQDEGALLLTLLDPRVGEVRIRRVDGADDEQARLDAAAVISRASLEALQRERAGRWNNPATPVNTPPAATPPSRPPPPAEPARRGQVRLLLAYTGSRYAPDFPWLSGLDLGVSFLSPMGAFVGASYLVTSPLSLTPYSLGGDDVVLGKVRRRPISLLAGYHRLWRPSPRGPRIGLEAEFAAVADITAARTPVVCIDEAGEECTATRRLREYDPIRLTLGFAPRLRLLIEPVPAILIFVGAGVDVFADSTIYATCTEASPDPCRSDVLFAPHNVRPVGQAGLLFRL
ncbi:MAG: hypothetical protein H6711_12105 [Myxococcales bacterium]|nr:hypothetical protein [Myxococcales bacterium]